MVPSDFTTMQCAPVWSPPHDTSLTSDKYWTRCVAGLDSFLCFGGSNVTILDVYKTATVGIIIAGVGVRVFVRVKVQDHTHGYVGNRMG